MIKKLSPKHFHLFVKKELKAKLTERYQKFDILSEADLQAYVWKYVSEFINEYDSREEIYKVLNKPYIKMHHIHPDLIVFKRMIPWMVFELKETRQMNKKKANEDRKRMIEIRKTYPKLKRGYFVCLSRLDKDNVFERKKGDGARFFFPISIVLESIMSKDGINIWEIEFKKWSKYVSPNN